ncbi:hypothetical protein M23134_03876 [Microscilla marina ATCC 23134]|uniref:Uncharacterized protein n=1 Tax=Microscilla marina ATCC 23134 TaxID=313606 RepID=A1ZME3_MICM2|nr:hypothetical protein M23134_03876 [Microscilla marina ATCC 23134]
MQKRALSQYLKIKHQSKKNEKEEKKNNPARKKKSNCIAEIE